MATASGAPRRVPAERLTSVLDTASDYLVQTKAAHA
jgi:hypothetical protein